MYNLTYRPQTIDELDNSTAREQLKKILASDNIPHAFLFAGPKGTGKTSAARILAKTLNGKENADAIAKGTSPDVIEMDAASNRKIDDIRDLISELKFAPLTSKYKIYIIDEVHMLTKEAFNALLKSLEEPPASTLFILATTEADSLPRTIVSRCMTINFREAEKSDIMGMMKRIIKGEKLSIPDDVVEYIADHADKSFRDAAKILNLAVIQDAKTVDDVKELLGQTWHKGNLLEIIDTGSTSDALSWIEESAKGGTHFRSLIEDLLSQLHTQLLKKNNIEVPETAEYTFSTKEIAQLMGLLHKAYNEMKIAPIQQLPLEIAVVTFIGTRASTKQ